jgi:hypothetical protein
VEKKPRLQEPAAMFNTSEPYSKVLSREELEEAVKKLQANQKLQVNEVTKKKKEEEEEQ